MTLRYHPDDCLCWECAEDLEKWGHRRVRDPNLHIALENVSDETICLLAGISPQELDEMRKHK